MHRLLPALGPLLLAACSAPVPSLTGTPTPNPSLSAAPSPVESAAVSAVEPPQVSLELVGSGLQAPSTVTVAPDSTLYVNETHTGFVRVISRDGTLRPEPFLDFSNRISTDLERGLLARSSSPSFVVLRTGPRPMRRPNEYC